MVKYWKMGFTGASVDALTEWATDQLTSEDQSICIPFAGSAKEVHAFAAEGRTIYSWDQQYLSKLAVDGVFNACAPDIHLSEFKLRKGYAFENRMKDMPDRVAGLIDYIAGEGTLYERCALSTAIVRGTYMGRLSMWGRSVTEANTLKTYQNRLKANADYTSLPGERVHSWASVLEAKHDVEYDLLYIDPPKVVGLTDIYFKGFVLLNEILYQDALPFEFTRWNKRNFEEQIREVLSIPSRRIIFDYLTGADPSLEDMLKILADYGTIVHTEEFSHGKRTDTSTMIVRD